MSLLDIPQVPNFTGKVTRVVDGKRVETLPSKDSAERRFFPNNWLNKREEASVCTPAATLKPHSDLSIPCAEVKPNTKNSTEKVSIQETPIMNIEAPRKKDTAGVLSKAIRNKIVEHPGIKKDALIAFALKEVPSATEAKVLSTIGNLIYGERIRGDGKGPGRTFHLNTEVYQSERKPKVTQPKVNKPVGKLVTGKEAAALSGYMVPEEQLAESGSTKGACPIPAAAAKYPAPGSDDITIIIDDKNNLCISLADIDLELSPAQTARLHDFMQRVRLNGAIA